MNHLLIEMQYLGPISYYLKLMAYDKVVIERHENFVKSTYRNRCYIAGPNGKLRLSIPLRKGKSQRSKYKEVKIAYDDHDWQKDHWNGLCSCYRRSPYFEFYEDRFEPFYKEQHEYLFEFNEKLMALILKLLGLDLGVTCSEVYVPSPEDAVDARSSVLPNESPRNPLPQYHQVFQDKTGFLEDLSIVDLLFNEGPNAKALLLPFVDKA